MNPSVLFGHCRTLTLVLCLSPLRSQVVPLLVPPTVLPHTLSQRSQKTIHDVFNALPWADLFRVRVTAANPQNTSPIPLMTLSQIRMASPAKEMVIHLSGAISLSTRRCCRILPLLAGRFKAETTMGRLRLQPLTTISTISQPQLGRLSSKKGA